MLEIALVNSTVNTMKDLWDLVRKPIPEDNAKCTAFLAELATGLRKLCNDVLNTRDIEAQARLHAERSEVLKYVVSDRLDCLLSLFPAQPCAILITAYVTAGASALTLLSRAKQERIIARVQECLDAREGTRKYLLYLVYTQSLDPSCVEPCLPRLLRSCVETLNNGSVSEVFQSLQVVEYISVSFPQFMEAHVGEWMPHVFSHLTHQKSNIRCAVSRIFESCVKLLLALDKRNLPELPQVCEGQLTRIEEMCEERLLPNHAVLFGYIVLISHKQLQDEAWRKRVRSIALNKLKMNKVSSTSWCWRFVIEAYVRAGLVDKGSVTELQSVLTELLDSPASVAFPTWTYFICALNRTLHDETIIRLVARPFLQGNSVQVTQARYFLSLFFEDDGDHDFTAPLSYFEMTRLKCLTNENIVPSVVRMPRYLFAQMLPLVLSCKPLCKLMSPGNPVSPRMHFPVVLKKLQQCKKSREAFLFALQDHRAIVQILKLVAYDMDALLADDVTFNCRMWILVAGAVEVWRCRYLDEVHRSAAALSLLSMPFVRLGENLMTYSSIACIWSQLFHELFSNRFALPKKEQDICSLFSAINRSVDSKPCKPQFVDLLDACMNSVVLRVATSAELGNSGLSPAGWCFRILVSAMSRMQPSATNVAYASLVQFVKKTQLVGDVLEMLQVRNASALTGRGAFEDVILQLLSTLNTLKRQIRTNAASVEQLEQFLLFCFGSSNDRVKHGAMELTQSLKDAKVSLSREFDLRHRAELERPTKKVETKNLERAKAPLETEQVSKVVAPRSEEKVELVVEKPDVSVEVSIGQSTDGLDNDSRDDDEEEATQLGAVKETEPVVATQVAPMPPPAKSSFVRIKAKKRPVSLSLTSRQKSKLRKTCDHLDMYGLNQSSTCRPEFEFNYLLSQTQTQTQASPSQMRKTAPEAPFENTLEGEEITTAISTSTRMEANDPANDRAAVQTMEQTLDQTLIVAPISPTQNQREPQSTQIVLSQTLEEATVRPQSTPTLIPVASTTEEDFECAEKALSALRSLDMNDLLQTFRSTLERVRRL